MKRGGIKIKFEYSVPPQNPPLKDLRIKCKHLVLVSMKIFKDTRVGKQKSSRNRFQKLKSTIVRVSDIFFGAIDGGWFLLVFPATGRLDSGL